MPRAVNKCRFCGVTIRWKGDGTWSNELGSTKCPGQPKGHKPPNTLGKWKRPNGGKAIESETC